MESMDIMTIHKIVYLIGILMNDKSTYTSLLNNGLLALCILFFGIVVLIFILNHHNRFKSYDECGITNQDKNAMFLILVIAMSSICIGIPMIIRNTIDIITNKLKDASIKYNEELEKHKKYCNILIKKVDLFFNDDSLISTLSLMILVTLCTLSFITVVLLSDYAILYVLSKITSMVTVSIANSCVLMIIQTFTGGFIYFIIQVKNKIEYVSMKIDQEEKKKQEEDQSNDIKVE